MNIAKIVREAREQSRDNLGLCDRHFLMNLSNYTVTVLFVMMVQLLVVLAGLEIKL